MVTKANRLSAGLEKDHHFDACIIAAGTNFIVMKTKIVYLKKYLELSKKYGADLSERCESADNQ